MIRMRQPRPGRAGLNGWVLSVWTAQLVPAVLLLAYAGWHVVVASGQAGRLWHAALGLAILWSASAIAVLASRRGRAWLLRHGAEWLLVAGAVLAGVVITDLALTVTGFVPTIAEQRDHSFSYTVGPYSDYRLVPKTVLIEGGEPIRINRRGFRGPEIEENRPAARARVVFMGGSQVFGHTGKDWPAMTGQLLRNAGHDVDVVNAAVPGYNSTDSVRSFLTDVWTLRPDVVFFCHAWNDVKYFRRMAPGVPFRGLPPDEPVNWEKDWRLYPSGLDGLLTASALYRRLRVDFIQSFITEEGLYIAGLGRYARPPEQGAFPGSWGPEQFRTNLELMADLGRRKGFTLVLCRQARLESGAGRSEEYLRRNTGLTSVEFRQTMQACDEIVADVAAQNRLPLVDMQAALGARPDYFQDAIHFTDAGSEAASEVVAATIGPLLARRAGD